MHISWQSTCSDASQLTNFGIWIFFLSIIHFFQNLNKEVNNLGLSLASWDHTQLSRHLHLKLVFDQFITSSFCHNLFIQNPWKLRHSNGSYVHGSLNTNQLQQLRRSCKIFKFQFLYVQEFQWDSAHLLFWSLWQLHNWFQWGKGKGMDRVYKELHCMLFTFLSVDHVWARRMP